MSEKLFRLLLSELTTARVVCMRCGGVAEFPADQLDVKFSEGLCHFCRQPLQMPQSNALVLLGKAIRGLNQSEKFVEVRFDVKEQD